LLAYIGLGRPPKVESEWVRDLGGLAGLALLATAGFGRVWCLLFIAGKKNYPLVTDGPYSIVRHPLYVFSFLGAVGFGLAVENSAVAALLAVLFAAYYSFVVRREERFLSSTFGALFEEYAARTPRWFPNPGLYREPEGLTISPRKMRQGIFEAMWFVWAYLLWELLEVLRTIGLLANPS
jgi:protein-S-isoprenylcysteine O-methyltransferase Ste14